LEYFSRYLHTKKMAALDAEVNKRFPSPSSTSWNYNSRLVQTVNDHHNGRLSLMNSVIDNADKWDAETIYCARSLLPTLQDFDFNFSLIIFSLIFFQRRIFFKIYWYCFFIFDIAFCHRKVEGFFSHLLELSEDFDFVWNQCNACGKNKVPQRKRIQIDFVPEEDRKYYYRRLFYKVIGVISSNIQYGFK
jgi:hypothetical protein